MNQQAKLRQQVLELLYQARQSKPREGWVAEADIKDAVGDTGFALSVLEEIGHIRRDGYKLRITGGGALACEQAAEIIV